MLTLSADTRGRHLVWVGVISPRLEALADAVMARVIGAADPVELIRERGEAEPPQFTGECGADMGGSSQVRDSLILHTTSEVM